uniref:Uncharacterized protein n=1 Tax=Knipowitschia caucasica TaxID=637954 RepID=A0AAV2M0C6_KNICA
MCEKDTAKEMVELQENPGDREILKDYNSVRSLSHRSRRQLVDLLVSDMSETHGQMPSRKQKESYALRIITLFSSLKDPFSQKGYTNLAS